MPVFLLTSPSFNKPYCGGYPFCCTAKNIPTNDRKKIIAKRRTTLTEKHQTCFTKDLNCFFERMVTAAIKACSRSPLYPFAAL